MARLLVIHDDAVSRTALIRQLSSAGHAVRSAPHTDDAFKDVSTDPPDVVVVGLDAADAASVDVLRWMRGVCPAPVIVASPLGDEAGVTRLLRGGADGVVLRPFSAPLLVARVSALLRRSLRGRGPDMLVVGGLRLEPRRRVATLDGRRLRLTPREFELLVYLARRPGEVVSRRTILAEVWNCAYVDPQTVNVHLSCLRRKLGETASEPRYLYTVRGVGVRLEPPDEEPSAPGAA
jgi:two-component system response regulator PrrA